MSFLLTVIPKLTDLSEDLRGRVDQGNNDRGNSREPGIHGGSPDSKTLSINDTLQQNTMHRWASA
jgi:hypothetical protein